MVIREAACYLQRLVSLWQGVSEAYAANDAEAARRLSDEIDRLQLRRWQETPDQADAN